MNKRKKPNFELKAKAIENNFVPIQRKYSYISYKYSKADLKSRLTNSEMDVQLINDYLSVKNQYEMYLNSKDGFLYMREAEKINKASYARRKRLSNRIENIISNNESCVFLTLTFNNDTLKDTSIETRRRYVCRYLKSCCCDYVANVDFGRKNEREHYHAIVVGKADLKAWHKYGGIKAEIIRKDSNPDILAKYICKLVNHAIKETVKNNYCIYSKNV